jgi:hypothetical protein
VVKFHITSAIDVYGSIKRISPAAKSQMTLDALAILDGSKRLVKVDLRPLEDYCMNYFSLVQYDEPTALNNIVQHMATYPLRTLKNYYLYSGKDITLRKGLTSSALVIKTEKLVTIFELSRSCLCSLVEDRHHINQDDCSPDLIQLLLTANDRSKLVAGVA